METFNVSRSLLNPKFEGYKLDPISQEDLVTRYSLQYQPTQAIISGRSTFSFHEVQSRITHNHIAVCQDTAHAAYVDADFRVILITVDPESTRPTFQVLYELPKAISSWNSDSRNSEYPSIAFFTPTILLVSDGHGVLYVLQMKENSSSELLSTFTLCDPFKNSPFRIHSIHRTSPTFGVAILSSRHYDGKSDNGHKGADATDYDVWGVKFDMLSLRSQNDKELRDMNILWHRRGQDVPIYTAYEKSLESFLVIGGSAYREAGEPIPPSYHPSTDEIAPIPRVGEDLDSQLMNLPKPPPYSWTQTHDSLTVAFPLPSSTPKSRIHVNFSPKHLALHIDADILTSVPTPRYSNKYFWDGILVSTSYWTWDREAEHSFGLLTLHLDKQHPGTRWSHLFSPASTSTTSSEPDLEDVEVSETIDPSELWHIRESLEKYTAALQEGDDPSGLGLGQGVPSLAEGEIDMEVDDSIGRTAYLTWIGSDGTAPSWWKNAKEYPFQLLSTPLPGSSKSVSLIVKSNLDGALFVIDPPTSTILSPRWIHSSTFNALAFVLASKRDTRFTYHITGKAVLAFEGGVRDRGGNVFIYRASATNEKWAKQAILTVGDGYGGSLLGVGAVNISKDQTVLLCLTEGELILITGP